jgi:hypothetical protein
MCSRIRVLPPLDIRLYQLLLEISVAVLDPFPVGMHLPILEAVEFNVPIVSAPLLQECTSRHVYGMMRAHGVGHKHISEYPSTVEDYAVYALSLQQDQKLRDVYRYRKYDTAIHDASDQQTTRRKKVLTLPVKKVDTGEEDDDDAEAEDVVGLKVSVPSHGIQLLNFIEKLMDSLL